PYSSRSPDRTVSGYTAAGLAVVTAGRAISRAAKIGGELALFAAARELEEDVFERVVLTLRLMTQLVERAGGHHPAVIDDADPMAQLLGNLQHMCRKETS